MLVVVATSSSVLIIIYFSSSKKNNTTKDNIISHNFLDHHTLSIGWTDATAGKDSSIAALPIRIMVRVLLVRHGMTKGNLRSARAAIQVIKGNITPEQMIDYENQQRDGEGLHEWSGDTQLSGVGKEELSYLVNF